MSAPNRLDIKQDLLVRDSLFLGGNPNSGTVEQFVTTNDENENMFCLELDNVNILCATADAITFNAPFMVEIGNKEPLRVNLVQETIGITGNVPLLVSLQDTNVELEFKDDVGVQITNILDANFEVVPLVVDTELDSIGISSLPEPVEVTTNGPIDVNITLTEISASNLQIPLPVTSTNPISVSLDSTDIEIAQWPELAITTNGSIAVTDPNLVEIEISNWPDDFFVQNAVGTTLVVSDPNLTQIEITNIDNSLSITVAGGASLPVNIQNTELDVSVNTWPTDDINAIITGQNDILDVQSNNQNVATEDTLANIHDTIRSTNSYQIPLDRQLTGIKHLIYASSYKGLRSNDYNNNAFYEFSIVNGTQLDSTGVTAFTEYGIEVTAPFIRSTNFFVPNDGRTLYLWKVGNFNSNVVPVMNFILRGQTNEFVSFRYNAFGGGS